MSGENKVKRVLPTCFNCNFGDVREEDPPCDICENASEWVKRD